MRRGTSYESEVDRHRYRTFGEAAGVWFGDPEWRGKSRSRQALSYEAVYDYIGEMPLRKVDDPALSQFKQDRLAGVGRFKRAAKPGTVDKDLTFVSTILNYSVRVLRWISAAPLIRQINGRRMQPQAISWEQQDAWFSELPDYMLGPAVFAVNTGARMGEIIGPDGLTWDQLQRIALSSPRLWFGKGRESFVFVVDGKNGHERAIVL